MERVGEGREKRSKEGEKGKGREGRKEELVKSLTTFYHIIFYKSW